MKTFVKPNISKTKLFEPELSETKTFEPKTCDSKTIMGDNNNSIIVVGTLGHVSHGKSTLVHKLSGIKPQKHSDELKRNITIKLGYANFNVYACECPIPSRYSTTPQEGCKMCKSKKILVKRFSFVDCPGHECLMTTMITGASVMDLALLIIAANQSVPQPQTREHLAAAEMMGLKNIIVCQTKLDLVDRVSALQNAADIRAFIKGTVAENAPIIPISCIKDINIDVLLHVLYKMKTIPRVDADTNNVMKVIRSFDVNKPGTDALFLKGGVIGGAIANGVFKIGQDIKILPGMKIAKEFQPIVTQITSIRSQDDPLETTLRGGLLALGTKLDPTLTKKDRLVGQTVVMIDHLYQLSSEITFYAFLMKRVEGAEERTKISSLIKDEVLYIHLGSKMIRGKIVNIEKTSQGKRVTVKLAEACCMIDVKRLALSRKQSDKFRLIGFGTFEILKGQENIDVQDFSIDYPTLLKKHYEIPNTKEKLSLTHPIVHFVNKRTIWSNFAKICDALKRPHEHVLLFFWSELGTTGSIDSQANFIIHGKFKESSIKKLLRTYVTTYVCCNSCRSFQTKLEKNQITCDSCKSTYTVDRITQHRTKSGKREE